MMREEFEKAREITVLRSDSGGITRESLDNARVWLKRSVDFKPERIYLLYVEDPWDYFTYVVDRKGKGFRFSGFSWGYGGEGPRGLGTLITEILGWKMPREVPAANALCALSVKPSGRTKSMLA